MKLWDKRSAMEERNYFMEILNRNEIENVCMDSQKGWLDSFQTIDSFYDNYGNHGSQSNIVLKNKRTIERRADLFVFVFIMCFFFLWFVVCLRCYAYVYDYFATRRLRRSGYIVIN
jgi:hypothetical protein